MNNAGEYVSINVMDTNGKPVRNGTSVVGNDNNEYTVNNLVVVTKSTRQEHIEEVPGKLPEIKIERNKNFDEELVGNVIGTVAGAAAISKLTKKEEEEEITEKEYKEYKELAKENGKLEFYYVDNEYKKEYMEFKEASKWDKLKNKVYNITHKDKQIKGGEGNLKEGIPPIWGAKEKLEFYEITNGGKSR